MSSFFGFLSGNVPGGIVLFLLLLFVCTITIFYLYKVNEFFTKKHFYRWLMISIVILSIIYISIWYQNPPLRVYTHYTIDVFISNTKNNWLGKNLTEIISNRVKSFRTDRCFFLPYNWLYRLTPLDSVENQNFRQNIFRKIPIQQVLKGKINSGVDNYVLEISLIEYPSEKILKTAKADFDFNEIDNLILWLAEKFGDEIPFYENKRNTSSVSLDSVLTLAKWHFYRNEYEKSINLLLKEKDSAKNPAQNKWIQYNRIKLAAIERSKNPPQNYYQVAVPKWKNINGQSRNHLISLLQADQGDYLENLMVAESYFLEEEFSNAEIFLEQAYVQNPFEIDILLNLTFLHPTRYAEFGFIGKRDIYQRILILCPVYEKVLLLWSKFILASHPVYTPSPELAKVYLEKYLNINPYSPEVWQMIGEIYSKETRREQALKSFLKADSIKPRNGKINYNLGVLYYEWEKLVLAKEYFTRSINYGDYLNSHLYLGAIFKDEGNYEKALERFRYRVAHKTGEDDLYAYQAMNGIKLCLEALKQQTE